MLTDNAQMMLRGQCSEVHVSGIHEVLKAEEKVLITLSVRMDGWKKEGESKQ